MKRILVFVIVIVITGRLGFVFSQGWHAVIEVDFNHGNVPINSIRQAYISFSGATLSGSFPSSTIKVSLTGEGTPSGPLYIKASGTTSGASVITDITSTYTGDILANCQPNYLEAYGYGTEDQYITGTITVYPRLTISGFSQNCDEIMVVTNSCSDYYDWEISENIAGPYQTITGSHSSTVTLTREEIYNLGFATGYGRKYIRATGLPGTTSQLQPVDVYFPGPTATFTVTSPKCHDGADGMITIDVDSSYPDGIQDFLITAFKNNLPVDNIILEHTNVVTISNLSAGNYRFQIQNHSSIETYGSCLTEYAVDPLVNPTQVAISSFQVSDYNGYPIKCKGGNSGTLQVIPAGGTGVFSAYEWMPNVSSGDAATNLSEQTYTIRVKDSNNCWSKAYQQTLTAPELLAVSLESTGGKNGFDVGCPDSRDGVITTTLSGGIPDYAYTWSDGSSLSQLTAVGTGKHTLTVTDRNGCTGKASLTLAAPPPIDFSIMEISGIICPGDHSGALQAQSNVSVTGPAYYSWSSGESEKEISGKAAGTYALTVSDENGCEVTKSKALAEPLPYLLEVVPATDYNGSVIKCHGDNNGKLEAIVRDENNDITSAEYYSWYKDESQIMGGPSVDTLEQLTAGTYHVEILYKDRCRMERSYTIKEPDAVLPSISGLSDYHGFPISCYGQSDGIIEAVGKGGTGNTYAFMWNTGETDAVLTNIGVGKYAVIARDTNGCEGKGEKLVTGPEPVTSGISIVSDFNGQPISCYGAADGQMTAFAHGGTGDFAFTWDTGNKGPDILDVQAGDYIVTATDLNGCTSLAEISIENPSEVNAIISETSNYHGYGVTCNGSQDGFIITKGTGGTGTYDYAWDGFSHYDSLYGDLRAGTYEISITDENGCAATTRATITEPSTIGLMVAAVKDITCYQGMDGQIQLKATGGAGAYEYSTDGLTWQSHPTLTGLKATTYRIEARDINGCVQSISQTLAHPGKLIVNFNDVEPAYCGDDRGKATGSVTGGTGDYRYEWTGEQSKILSHEEAILNLPSGVYTLRVVDENNCEATNAVGITSDDGPKVSISQIISATCSYSSDGSALLEISEGNGPFKFHWPDGQTTSEGMNLSEGDYLVAVTDSNGCMVIESVAIPAPQVIDIHLLEGVEPGCNGDCNGKLKVSASGGNGNYLYQWTNFSGSEYNDLCAGNYQITVIDQKGCHSEKTYSLHEPSPIVAKLMIAESPVCHDRCDGKLTIEASGGTGALAFVWSTDEKSPEIDGLCAGTYTAVITDGRQCSITESYTLDAPSDAALDLGGSATLCADQTHMLDAGSGYESYSWSGNNGFSSSAQKITIRDAGLYWLEAISHEGCRTRDTFLLETTADLLNANFLLTTQAKAGDTVVMIDISWPLPEHAVWKFPREMKRLEDLGDRIYGRFDDTGSYDISLMTTLGVCRDEITKSIAILARTSISEGGRLGHAPQLKDFTLYPNPNEGKFAVSVELLEESPVILSVWNIQTARKIYLVHESGRMSYLKNIDLGPVSSGTYTLRLDYAEGTRYIRFIVR